MTFLTDLAIVCRRTGFPVIEVDGWQTRTRGSAPSGYGAGRPTHVMVHHTASGANSDGWDDVNYIAFGAQDAPLANLYVSRVPQIFVIAAGPTNTNGSGHDTWGGGVPEDSMNSHAIGIEGANNGVGEPWPGDQQNCYLALCDALCEAYGIFDDHVRAHFEWAPDRKIDAAGPARWTDPGDPSMRWYMPGFRDDITPTPQPQPEDDVPFKLILVDARPPHAMYVCDGNTKTWVRDGDAGQQIDMRLQESANGTRPSPWDGYTYRKFEHGGNDVIASYGPIVGPRPDFVDEYGRW